MRKFALLICSLSFIVFSACLFGCASTPSPNESSSDSQIQAPNGNSGNSGNTGGSGNSDGSGDTGDADDTNDSSNSGGLDLDLDFFD